MTRVYISGGMTGIPDLNFPAFNKAEADLRAIGYDVVNPAKLNPGTEKTWADCMRVDIAALLGCDAIAMLPGWIDSRGARLEHRIAKELGMQVFSVRLMFGQEA